MNQKYDLNTKIGEIQKISMYKSKTMLAGEKQEICKNSELKKLV